MRSSFDLFPYDCEGDDCLNETRTRDGFDAMRWETAGSHHDGSLRSCNPLATDESRHLEHADEESRLRWKLLIHQDGDGWVR